MNNTQFFVSGTGTGIGKTMVSAILAEALNAGYWKPIQAGIAGGTDSQWVRSMTDPVQTIVHPETYIFNLAASPHIAAREENRTVDLQIIKRSAPSGTPLIVEGAGGLMVPLNDNEFISDLVNILDMQVILVSKNELGSINHSLLTAMACREKGIKVAGWIFNGSYLDYEEEIVRWTGIPKIATIPFCATPDRAFIIREAAKIKPQLI